MIKRFGPSNIEYLTHVWNPYSGCRNKELGVCPVPNCWAEGIIKHFPGHYPHGFAPTFYPSALLSPLKLRKPARVGVAFMGDLFGDWNHAGELPKASIRSILTTVRENPQHTFLFLTKAPWNLKRWEPFPDNAWIGVSATNYKMFSFGLEYLKGIRAKVKYLSLEPMLERLNVPLLDEVFKNCGISWIIVGAQTKPTVIPETAWVMEIVEAADKSGIPVFLKNNLGWPKMIADGSRPFYQKDPSGTWVLRQEYPQVLGKER